MYVVLHKMTGIKFLKVAALQFKHIFIKVAFDINPLCKFSFKKSIETVYFTKVILKIQSDTRVYLEMGFSFSNFIETMFSDHFVV